MLKIELNFQDLYSVIKKLREASDSDFLLEVSENCPFLENLLAFKIIKSEARSLGRKIVFAAKNPEVSGLVETLNDDTESFGFVRGFDVGSKGLLEKPPVVRVNYAHVLFSFLKSKLSIRRDLGFVVAVVVGLLLLAFYLLFYYLPKATITLTVEAESLVESIDVVASPSAQRVDSVSRVIPAVEISSVSKKGASAVATGTKEVGDKASGEITIYNKTGSARTFSAKTVFAKGRKQGVALNYLLGGDVVVPAQVSDNSGVATTSATAEKIGEEYNIPANNTLIFSGDPTSSSFYIENTKNFSGGSRRSITVVTDDDQKKLLSSVKNDLEAELASQLRAKLVSDQKMEESSLNFTVTSKTYDKNVAEEASSFNLVLEEKSSALVYSESDIKSLLSETLKGYVPNNYELFGKDYSVEVISAKYDSGNLFFTTKIRGFIVPRLDEKKIREGVAGLSLPSARKYLGGLSNITSYQIDNFLNLPAFSFLPRNKNAIRVVITRK